MNNKDNISERLSNIRILAMDVDGTLTDSTMYYSAKGEELKRFSTRDGMGITLLKLGGISTAFITSENSPIVTARAEKLSIEYVIIGCRDKSTAISNLAESNDLKLSEIAYIGDDINDEHVMKIVGFSACPNDAVDVIKKTANYICESLGGQGAVREFAELILMAQNKKINIQEQW